MKGRRHTAALLRSVGRLLLVAAICSASAGTHGTIEGVVRDAATGAGLPGATVTVMDTPWGAVTDSAGRYRITGVRAGLYDVRVSFIGYRAAVIRGVNVLADLRTTADAQLEPSAVEMNAVEVRAVRPLIQRDLAGTAFNVGSDKMELLPVSNVQEVLALQPGTTLEGHVRGGKTTEVLYLIDGMPIMDVLGGGSTVSVPRSAITGLTLQTGGFEAEYGNAQSGIVNIVTRTGGNDARWSLRYERDDWLPERWSRQTDRSAEIEAAGTGPLVRDKVFAFGAVTVRATDTRWWQDFRRQVGDPVEREISGIAKVEYVHSLAHRLSLQLVGSEREWRDYEFSWRFNLNGLPSRQRSAFRGSMAYTWNGSPGVLMTATASLYEQYSKIGEGSPKNLSLAPYEYDFFLRYVVSGHRLWWQDAGQRIATGRVEASVEAFEQHLFKAGVEVNQYRLQSDLFKYEPRKTYFGKPLVDQPLLNYSNSYKYRPRSGSVYIQDKVQTRSDGSILTVGLRWDWLDPTARRPRVEFIPVGGNEYDQVISGSVSASLKQQISPRVSYTAPFGPSSYFFVNVGQYFQFPLFDLLYSGLQPQQLALGAKNVQAGNPDLQPERTMAWELGLKHALDGETVISGTYFRKRMENQIDAKTLIPFDSKSAGDFGFASYVNNAEARAEGVEILVTRESGDRIRGSFSYSYMVTDGISESVDQGVNLAQWGFSLPATAYPLSWDQRHTVKADVEALLFGVVRGDLIVLYNSPRPYTYFPTRDGVTPIDTSRVFQPNNARMGHVLIVNAKATVVIPLGSRTKMTVYVDGRNVLNTKNVRWMDSSGKVGGELGDPSAYYDPRRVRFGMEITF